MNFLGAQAPRLPVRRRPAPALEGAAGTAAGRAAQRAQHVLRQHVKAPRPAVLPVAERRRLEGGVGAQHLFEQAGVGVLEGRDVPVEQGAGPPVGRWEQSGRLVLDLVR